jgi:inner membrane protein
MDPFTHGLLGANIGQSLSKKYLTLKTLVIAGFVAMMPDLDVLQGLGADPLLGLFYHRSITHSLFFGPVAGPILGLLISRFSRPPQRKDDFLFYSFLCALVLESHVLLDLCTSYGTQIFAPFSHVRMALNIVGIIDPFYTIPLLISFLIGLYYLKRSPEKGLIVGRVFFVLTTGLLFIFFHINQTIVATARESLKSMDNSDYVVKSYPMILQPIYRRVTAEDSTRQCVSYISLFRTKTIQWRCYQKQHHWAIEAIKNTPEGKIFEWFSMGQLRYDIKHPTPQTTRIDMIDFRYAQLNDTLLWALRQTFDENQKPLTRPMYFSERVPINFNSLRELWYAAFH